MKTGSKPSGADLSRRGEARERGKEYPTGCSARSGLCFDEVNRGLRKS